MIFKWTLFQEDRVFQFGWTMSGFIEKDTYDAAKTEVDALVVQNLKNIISDDSYITALRISDAAVLGDALLNTYGTGIQGLETDPCVDPPVAMLLRFESADHLYRAPRWLHRIAATAFVGQAVAPGWPTDVAVEPLLAGLSSVNMRIKVKKKDDPGKGTKIYIRPALVTARGMTQKKVGRPFALFRGRHKRGD